jgi:putative nucleotidyltransferase with HDIG domain
MRYSVTVCKQLKMKPREIHIVKNAALLHDIGKIGIDRGILQKEGSLTLYEWEEIKKHPIIGAEIISRTEFLEDLIPIVEHHHARFTGGGYPDPALKRSNIPLGSKIIAIADAYDAMTSVRPYRKKPLTAQTALDEIEKHAGTQFDPHLSKVFIESMIQTV